MTGARGPLAWLRVAAAFLLLFCAVAVGAEEPRVGILLAEDAPAYREAAAAIEAVVVEAGVDAGAIRSWHLGQGVTAARPQRLLVTVGASALSRALAETEGTPILATLIPREAYARLAAQAGGRRLSAVWLDQPLARQVAAVAVTLPERKRVGVVVGPESQNLLAELTAAAEGHGLSVVRAVAASEREVFGALDRVLPTIDVLLATPDPRVYNASTLPNILLASYRRQVPLVGFSPAYLRAGALLTLQSSPAQMAASSAEIIRAALANRPLPPPRHVRDFTITVNRHVARSLGITLPADEVLGARLRAQEGMQ